MRVGAVVRRSATRARTRSRIADETARRRFLEAVRTGTPYIHAARYAGIPERTLFRYLARGEVASGRLEDGEPVEDPDDAVFAEFYRDTMRARSEGAVRSVALVQKAAAGGYVIRRTSRSYKDAATGRVITETVEDLAPVDWKAAAFVLSKSYAAEFGPSAQQVELSGPGGGPVQVGAPDVEALAARVVGAIAARRDGHDDDPPVDGDDGDGGGFDNGRVIAGEIGRG